MYPKNKHELIEIPKNKTIETHSSSPKPLC